LSEKKYVPKRGDLVRETDFTQIGFVLGWVDEDTIAMLVLPEKETYAVVIDDIKHVTEVELLVKAEEIMDLASLLPKQITLSETRPSS